MVFHGPNLAGHAKTFNICRVTFLYTSSRLAKEIVIHKFGIWERETESDIKKLNNFKTPDEKNQRDGETVGAVMVVTVMDKFLFP